MDFIDQIKNFSKRVNSLMGSVQTEEATKTSLIMPFFALLGYDVFNPDEFVPEFTADVGIKKGEKVDYAIFINGVPMILIEAKWIGERLEKHDSQLFRYFGTTRAKFAILTNGRFYKFYTDLEESNKMDETPFFEIDLLNIKDTQVPELKKFSKSVFDVNAVFDTASDLKYSTEFKSILEKELEEPSDDLVRFFLKNCYDGVKTLAVIDRFRPILKKSLNVYITELMNERITSALGNTSSKKDVQNEDSAIAEDINESSESTVKIITTPEEIESYYIVKSIVIDSIDATRITFKDNERYFSVMLDDSVRKQICRINLDGRKKYIQIPGSNKKFIRFDIESVNDIYNYRKELHDAVQLYL